MANQCQHINASGEQCKAYESKNTGYCVGHARQRGLLTIEKKPSAPRIEVSEPSPLVELRRQIEIIETGGSIDPAEAMKIANLLRPYLGIAPMDSVQLAGQIDLRQAADEQIARSEAAQADLLERSFDLVIADPDPARKREIEAKVARDLEAATTNYRTQMQMTKRALMAEPREQVMGINEEEVYVLNGVKVVIPADGMFSVPKSIARMHIERQRGKREAQARSALMGSTPEFSEVYRRMAEIDTAFGSKSQLGGGPQQEEADYIVAEEIKP